MDEPKPALHWVSFLTLIVPSFVALIFLPLSVLALLLGGPQLLAAGAYLAAVLGGWYFHFEARYPLSIALALAPAIYAILILVRLLS